MYNSNTPVVFVTVYSLSCTVFMINNNVMPCDFKHTVVLKLTSKYLSRLNYF